MVILFSIGREIIRSEAATISTLSPGEDQKQRPEANMWEDATEKLGKPCSSDPNLSPESENT